MKYSDEISPNLLWKGVQMEQNPAPGNMIDTTDCLEAVNVFKSMKNFTFWLIMGSLLILLGLFFLVRFGFVQTPQEAQSSAVSWLTGPKVGGLCLLAAQPTAPEKGESAPSAAPETYDPIEQKALEVTGQETSPGQPQVADTPEEPVRAEPLPQKEEPSSMDWSKLRLSEAQAVRIVRVFNYICLISAILYSLILLMTLKVSLTGRLGGIRHISRAFFISLFAFVFLFPWQAVLPHVLIGAIYLPAELIGRDSWLVKTSQANQVLMYIRFVGLWLVVFFLYLWAQYRSMKWARAILKRLGVVR